MSENIDHLLHATESLAESTPAERGGEHWAHGYDVREIINSVNTQGNSVVLDIEPEGGSTEAVLIAKDITLTVRPLEGKGKLVVTNIENPEAEVKVVELEQGEPYKLVKGDAYYYLNTGDKPLLIRDDCVPAFQGDEEIMLTSAPEEGQPDGRAIKLPNAFWLNYQPVKPRE